MFTHNISLAWHVYQQEKNSTHFRFLRWTYFILMVFVVTLSLTSHSIQSYLTDNLNNMLGADVVISQSRPMSDKQIASISDNSEQMIMTQTVDTTLTYGEKWQQVQLKIVDDGYPLHGALITSKTPSGLGEVAKRGPRQGEIWLDSRLVTSLATNVGDTIQVGIHDFIVTQIIMHEPDRLMEGHSVAMRAMINRMDLENLSLPLDTLHHRYLIAANSAQISEIIDWQKSQLPGAEIYHKQGSHPLALFWQRTENVIGLTSVILFFMAAIAIEQLTRVVARKEQFAAAVCMSFGASRRTSLVVVLLKWLILWASLVPVVFLTSAAFHYGLIQWMTTHFNELTWQWDAWVAIKSVLAVSIVIGIFALPVGLGIVNANLRQLIYGHQQKGNYIVSIGCALAVIAGVAVVYSDNGLLTAMILGAMFVCIVFIIAISWATLTLGEKTTQHVSGLLPFALFMMKQRLVSKSTQILGVGLCAFLLLFTLGLMKDLGNTMTAYSRSHDGNVMVSQATQEQMNAVQIWSEKRAGEVRQNRPFVYGRLLQINGLDLEEYSQKPSDSMATLSKSIRLHWTDSIPLNNRLVSGEWWQSNDKNWQQISVEEEVMTDLNLQLGDSLSLFVGENSFDFTIVASHVYKTGAGTITFWLQVPQTAMAHISAPRYNMASLELPEQALNSLGDLWQQHPALRMVSLQELTARFDKTLAMVTQVISGFAALIILLAMVVILASIHAIESQEKKKNSVIMSFGFTRKTCLKLNIMEWGITGFIAGAGAIIGTYLAGLLIYQSQFSLSYQPRFFELLGTLALILAVVTAMGVFFSKRSLTRSISHLFHT